jgi:hypothetical protein
MEIHAEIKLAELVEISTAASAAFRFVSSNKI